MKKLIIFDLLPLNTLADLACAANYALEQLGFAPHPEPAYVHFVGSGIMKLFERALPPAERTPENIQKMCALFVPYYDKHKTDKTVPYEGIVPLLEELSQRKIKLAVASNKYQTATEELIHHYFAGIDFAAVCGQCQGRPVKPDPLLVNQIRQCAQVAPEETLYVGDSDVDMQTARNAKVAACGVLWGFRTRKELAAYHPILLAEKPADILRII